MNEATNAVTRITATNKAAADTELDLVGGVRQMRALFVLNSLNVGGSETKVVRLVNGLCARNVLAGIAYLNDSNALLPSIESGVPLWHLDRRGKFSASAVARLRQILKRARPSVVFAVNLYPVLYVVLATAALRKRPRIVGLLNTTAPAKADEWRRSFYRPFLRRLDTIAFGSDVQRSEWAPYVRADAARTTVLYNGVDTHRFTPIDERTRSQARESCAIPRAAFVLGTVGRLASEKNQAVLIDALADLRAAGIEAHLLIVGEGPKRSELQQYAASLNMASHVTFAGMQADVRPWLAAMDVFVLPSTNVETFSNAALEAMASGKPVILSRLGGADEMVRDGTDGYVVDIDTLGSRVPTLLRSLARDPELRERLGRCARERVEQCFSMPTMIERFSQLIDRNTHALRTA